MVRRWYRAFSGLESQIYIYGAFIRFIGVCRKRWIPGILGIENNANNNLFTIFISLKWPSKLWMKEIGFDEAMQSHKMTLLVISCVAYGL